MGPNLQAVFRPIQCGKKSDGRVSTKCKQASLNDAGKGKTMRKFIAAVCNDKEWQVIAGIIGVLALASVITVAVGGVWHMLTLAIGVLLGCIGQAVMLELQKRD